MPELLREYVQALIEREVRQHCRYERLIIRTLRDVGIGGKIRSANCVDAIAPDADMKLDGEIFYVEVKASDHARMGSTSMGFSYEDRTFFPAGLNRELSSMVAELLNEMGDTSLINGLTRLIRFLKQDAIAPRKVSSGFPMSGFQARSWERARKAGLLRAINRRFNGDIGVIARHYARKNTFYVQIGGWGLYTLGGNNPAGLPVPALDGKVVLEIEAKKSGDIEGRMASKAAFRVHARMQPESPSPYSLDDPDSIKKMLLAMGDQSAPDTIKSDNGFDAQAAGPGVPEDAHVW